MRGGKAETCVRAYVDIEERRGELFALATAPDGLRSERPVAWAGGGLLLVAKGTASEVPGVPGVVDLAGLATAVEQGGAAPEELRRYGSVLFEAAFGKEFWGKLAAAAAGRHRELGAPGLPYLELAVRAPTAGEPTTAHSVHALRWEALHDGARAVAAQGTGTDGGAGGDEVSVGVVRLVPSDGGPPAAAGDDGALIRRIPRVLFAVGSALTDPGVRPAAELMGIMQNLDSDGGSIHPKILESATLPELRAGLDGFQPDVLHLIGHGGRLADGEVAVQLRPEPGAPGTADEWVTAEQLLGAFGKARHTPALVILSACQTASGTGADAAPGQADGGRVNAAPFAARLVAGGVPVVVAMAGDISDTACRVFTRALTSALGQGVPLGRAVLWGRCAAFYQRPGFWSGDWVLPTVFLAGHLTERTRLVNAGHAQAVRKRVHDLGLAQAPVFYGRREFVDAMDRLLDGADPLNVLLGYTADSEGSYGGERLLRQLGARALRAGVLPLLLGPFDVNPPTTRLRLAREITKAISNVRLLLELPPASRELRVSAAAAAPETEPFDLAVALRADLDDLVAALPGDDPAWSRAPGQPRAVLLCHRVDGWLDRVNGGLAALDDLLGMLGPTGLHPGQPPLPVVLTGADAGQVRDTRRQAWNGKPWAMGRPLRRFPEAGDEDLLAYEWWLINPPGHRPVYAPRRRASRTWGGLLRLFMDGCMYDEDRLFTFASKAGDYFTAEEDRDLLAIFARAAP